MAFDNFDLEKVALYGEDDRQRLLSDAGIIRNKLKVEAAIHNAAVILALRRKHGSFRQWLDLHHPLEKEAWVKLFKAHFRFTGGEIVNEFLMSTGYLPGAHHKNCAVYHEVLKSQPRWLTA
jgi:DNA-3-methyladenine glycosylase I